MRKLVLMVCLLLPAVLVAQPQQDFSKVESKVTNVSRNIYMLEGQGGNIAASAGEDGIVIVDDEFAPLAEKIQAADAFLETVYNSLTGTKGKFIRHN